MTICKYFLSGNCRYGSRCVNEHFDLKQYISTEVQAALKGSQWPLSCFGPFKEKPCIPNFIEDQSFEEVRLACYNAKKDNYFPAYQQQIAQQVTDAQNKMKMLLANKREIVDVIVKLYDDAEQAQKAGKQQAPARSNPFSITAGTAGQSGSSGALFGNAPQANPFASGSVFGGPAASSGSVFGAQPAAGSGSVLGQSVFGNAGFNTNQNSVFGGQQSITAQPQGGSIFAITSPAPQLSGGSIFGATAGQQQAPFSGSGTAFGSTNVNQTSIFSQDQAPKTFSDGGSFSQPFATGFNTQAASNFGQQQQPFQPQPPAPQQLPNQVIPQQQQTSGLEIFGSTGQQGFFGQAESNPSVQFGSSQGSIFSQMQPGATPFGATNQNTASMPPQNNFQQNPLLQATVVVGDSTYSKMEQLTAEEINAFKADRFEMGKIPANPPPRELI